MLDRLTTIQLSIFAVVTVLSVGAISIFYLHVPAALGIGAYEVTANFVAGGGLYENANVTYRGVTIGRVESVGLTDDGVVAHMRLNSDTPVPENVTATVKSVSAVGEQYVDLVPPEDPSHAMLRNGSTIPWTAPRSGRTSPGCCTQADDAGQQRRQQPDPGPAARDVQGVQRLRARTGAADPVGAAAGRRGQRQLRADHPADRPGGAVPGRADPQRRRHQVAGRRAGAVHRRGRQRRSAVAHRAADRAGRDRGGQHHVRRHPADVPDAGRQPGQLRPHRRHLQQVDRAGAGDLPRADGGADHRRWRPAGRRGRQAGLQDRPQRPAAVLDGLHPADADPLAGRHHAARSTDRPVLQDGAERSGRRARRAQLPVPGVPRQAGADDPAVPRPQGLRPGRHQPLARAAGAATGRRSRTGATSCRPTSSRSSRPRSIRIPGRRSVQLPPGVLPGPGPAPHAPFPLPVPPNEPGPCRPRGRTSRRPTRWCRRTAGPHRSPRAARPAGPQSRGHAAAAPEAPPGGPQASRTAIGDATTRTGSSSTPPAGLASSPPGLTNWRPQRTGST